MFSLTGAYLYRSLSAELQRRDDIEISGKLNQFAQLSRARGSAQAIRANPGVFHDVLLSHPGVYLGIYDARGTPLVEHADGPDPALKPLADGTHPDGQPFTCTPKEIGQARCIFSKVVLPSGEAIRMLLVRAAEDRQSLLDSYRYHIWFAIAAGPCWCARSAMRSRAAGCCRCGTSAARRRGSKRTTSTNGSTSVAARSSCTSSRCR